MDRYRRAKAIVDQVSSLSANEKCVFISIFDFDLLFDYDASKLEGLTQEYTHTPLAQGKKLTIGHVELVESDKVPQGSYALENALYNIMQFNNYE